MVKTLWCALAPLGNSVQCTNLLFTHALTSVMLSLITSHWGCAQLLAHHGQDRWQQL